jgi:phage protein D
MVSSLDRGSLQFNLVAVDAKGNELEVLTPYVKRIKYTREETGADKLEMEIDNNDLRNWSSRTEARFMQGRYVRLSYGYQSIASVVAILRITRVTGFTTLMVKAKNIGDKLNRNKKNRTFRNKTRAEVVKILAREHGMGVAEITDTGERFDRITQARETDAALCHRLAYKEGFKFSINQEGMRWSPRDFGKKERMELVYHTSQTGDIIGADLDMDVARLPRRIKSRTLNRETGGIEKSEVDNKTDRDREVLTEYSGWIPEEGPATGLVIQSEIIKTAKPTDTGKDATARFRLAQQRAIKLDLTIIGNPLVNVRDVIRVSGMGDILSGLYYVKCVEDEMGPSAGYVTRLKLTTDGVSKKTGGSANVQSSRSIIDNCIQEATIVLHNLASPGGLFNEVGVFIDSLNTAISGGKNPSASTLEDLIQQASYLALNLRAVGVSDAAILIQNCRASMASIQDDLGSEEKNQGKKNASFPEDGARAEAALFVENEGRVPVTVEGGSETLEDLGITNDRFLVRYLDR